MWLAASDWQHSSDCWLDPMFLFMHIVVLQLVAEVSVETQFFSLPRCNQLLNYKWLLLYSLNAQQWSLHHQQVNVLKNWQFLIEDRPIQSWDWWKFRNHEIMMMKFVIMKSWRMKFWKLKSWNNEWWNLINFEIWNHKMMNYEILKTWLIKFWNHEITIDDILKY